MTQERVVAIAGNPRSAKGGAAKYVAEVTERLKEAGDHYQFKTIDVTGGSAEETLANAERYSDEYDALVAVGGDGTVNLGVNAVADQRKPLGIVAVGSGNDFARSLTLPIRHVERAVEGIVGAIVKRSEVDIDLGIVTFDDSDSRSDVQVHAREDTQADAGPYAKADAKAEGSANNHSDSHGANPVNTPVKKRYFAGMLSGGIDAVINDRANNAKLISGALQYFLVGCREVLSMKEYGYHLRVTLDNGTIEEYDLLSGLFTIANSGIVGGGVRLCPKAKLDDGLLDFIWLTRNSSMRDRVQALRNAYNGKILDSNVFGWRRIKTMSIVPSELGVNPPKFMADGEDMGYCPLTVEVCPQRLRVLVPPAVAKEFYDEKTSQPT